MGYDAIRLGTLLFTLVEPTRGHEVEYNRWYERDHFYGGVLVGEYSFAGDRFVATRELKALRYPADSPMTPEPDVGSYLALYWVLDGHHDDWNRWSVDTVKNLHATGRMFPQRTHIHTVLYRHQWSIQPDPHGTPIELALDRDYPYLVVNVGELTAEATHDDLQAWTDAWMARAAVEPWGPDLVAYSTPLPLLADAPADVPRVANAERRFLQLHFCEASAIDGWADGYARFGADLDASGVARHLWTAPFRQTVVGTDTYTDQLW